jgi:hypothetical protein
MGLLRLAPFFMVLKVRFVEERRTYLFIKMSTCYTSKTTLGLTGLLLGAKSQFAKEITINSKAQVNSPVFFLFYHKR